MTICPHCGVEVEDTAVACPLCESPLGVAADREGAAGS